MLGWAASAAGLGWAEHSEMENTEGRSQQRCIALLLYLPSTLRSAETSENAAFESSHTRRDSLSVGKNCPVMQFK